MTGAASSTRARRDGWHERTGRRCALALALSAALLTGTAACEPAGMTSAGSEGAGYTAGDGSFTTWSDAERADPITAAGTTYGGEEVDLAQWRGDVVVLNFWYAACPPCRAEAPDLNAFHEEYAGEGVRMLGVNPRDDEGTAAAFERTFATPYPSIHDTDASMVASFEALVPLQAMPTTLVLDREGRPAARILGRIDPEVLRGLVDDVLTEESAAA